MPRGIPNKKPVVISSTTNENERTKILENQLKQKEAELNLANNKIAELTKIVESMKGQAANLEAQIKNERIKTNATFEYVLDSIKHAYISATMAIKGDK